MTILSDIASKVSEYRGAGSAKILGGVAGSHVAPVNGTLNQDVQNLAAGIGAIVGQAAGGVITGELTRVCYGLA